MVVLVDDGRGAARGADEAHAARVGGQLDGALRGHGVRRVEDSAVRNGTEHRQVLQRHLRRAVLACSKPITINR